MEHKAAALKKMDAHAAAGGKYPQKTAQLEAGVSKSTFAGWVRNKKIIMEAANTRGEKRKRRIRDANGHFPTAEAILYARFAYRRKCLRLTVDKDWPRTNFREIAIYI